MSDATSPAEGPLAQALAQLDEAMRPPRGSSNDPDRRRLAARLADLARCQDDELAAFAKRHLPGRVVDESALRAAREMTLTIGRILGPEGESAEALSVLPGMHRALEERTADARKAAALREMEAEAAASAPPPPVHLSAPPPPPPVHLSAPPPPPPPVHLSAPPPALEIEPPPPLKPPAWRPAKKTLGATVTAIQSPIHAALPFAPVAPGERVERAAARHDTALPFQPATSPRPSLDPTASSSASFAPPPQARPSEELPSHSPSEVMKHIQGFSLAQYAELCASVTAFPAQIVQIRGHYGMDVHAWTALHALWQDYFQRDPTLQPRWEALVKAALRRYPR